MAKKPNLPGGKGFSKKPGYKDSDYIKNYGSIFGEKKFHGRDSKPEEKKLEPNS